MSDKEKYLLSVVLCGRNDNYLGDFKYRISTAINYLARNAFRIGRQQDIEIVVVDWNSDVPLADVLPLIPEAVKITKFTIVPPDIASRYMQPGQHFNAGCAINTGIRRSNGEYIMLMPADILIPETSLMSLLLLLTGQLNPVFDSKKTMLNIGRKRIPFQVVERKLSLSEWDWYLQFHSRHLPYQSNWFGLCSGYGAILMHKHLWKECQGIKEKYFAWGWTDTELGLRVNQRYPSIDLIGFGILVYDMQQSLISRKCLVASDYKVSESLDAKNTEWGLQKHTLDVISSKADNKRLILPEKSKASTGAEKSFKDTNDKSFLRYFFANIDSITDLRLVLKKIHHTNTISELACLYFLTLYATPNRTQRYLEFGINNSCIYSIIADINPTAEMFGISDWNGDGVQSDPHFVSRMLRDSNFQGYSHFISGDVNTSLERLKHLYDEPLKFDLILFRVDMYKDNAMAQIENVMEILEEDAALIVIGRDNELFRKTWTYIRQKYSNYKQISYKGFNTGILLKYGADKRASIDADRGPYISRIDKMPVLQIYLMYALSKVLRVGRGIYRKIRKR